MRSPSAEYILTEQCPSICCVSVCGGFSLWWIILEKRTEINTMNSSPDEGEIFLWMYRKMSSFLLGFLGMESLNQGWSHHTKACQIPQNLEYFLPSQDFTQVMEFTGYVRKTRTCLHRYSFCFLCHHLNNFSQMKKGEMYEEGTEPALYWLALGTELRHGCH